MTFDGTRMLMTNGGTQVDYSEKEGNKRKKGESWGGAQGFDVQNRLG